MLPTVIDTQTGAKVQKGDLLKEAGGLEDEEYQLLGFRYTVSGIDGKRRLAHVLVLTPNGQSVWRHPGGFNLKIGEPMKLDNFTHAYIDTMLWSESANEDGESFSSLGYDRGDLAPCALKRCVDDCRAFQEPEDVIRAIEHEAAPIARDCGDGGSYAMAGHDFWLTRNGHGAGFWDGDWDKADPDGVLDKRATELGHVEAYLGDDGLIYIMGAEGRS